MPTVRTLARLQARLSNARHGNEAADLRDLLVSVFPPQFSGALVRKSSAQTIAATTTTPLTWATEIYDTDDYADLGSDNDALSIPFDGYYVVTAGAVFSGGATNCILTLVADGNNVTAQQNNATNSPQISAISAPLFLSASDLVSATIFLGAQRDASVADQTFLAVHRVGQAPV